MENYVTLFDSLFLPQGLALHRSMERHIKCYSLWILCVDDEVYEALLKLKLPNTRLLKLSILETAELLKIKSSRTKGEYCWTLTPFTPRFVFEADPAIERVTYLDADMWFRKSPAPIFKELTDSGKHVLITDHAYAPEHDQSQQAGQYCVQFMIFTRNGELVRKWWEERCLEWCYARYEDGKFGDQKYLDSWPEMFKDHVHVLHDHSLLLAPWNGTRFPYSSAIAWHFHSARLIIKNKKSMSLWAGNYYLPPTTVAAIYKPYFLDITESVNQLLNCGIEPKTQKAPNHFVRIGLLLREAYRKLVKLQAGQMIR